MKKVGLITYYGKNYGGMLQAYALQKVVKQGGYACKIISNDFLYNETKQDKVKRIINKLIYVGLHFPTYMKKRKAVRKYSVQRKKSDVKFDKFLKDNLEIDYTGYTKYQQYLDSPPQYDIYLIGSDQVWNPNLYSDNGFYFAGFAPNNALKISYASSIGVSSVSKKQADFMRPLLNNLDVISTRESDGAKIVEAISSKKATTVLDPTLLLNEEEWDDVSNDVNIDEPYIFAYLFGEREYIENVKIKVKEITGYRIVSIPQVAREYASDDIKMFDVGPSEFLSLIKKARLVLTDSFHATVFSINMKIPFISLCRFSKNDKKGMNSRMYTILDMLDLSERLIDDTDEITREFLYDINFENAHRILEEKRKENKEFVFNSLKLEKE